MCEEYKEIYANEYDEEEQYALWQRTKEIIEDNEYSLFLDDEEDYYE